jgi:hypothetical protein
VIGEDPVPNRTVRSFVYQQTGGVSPLGRALGDQLPGKVVVELG